MQPPTRDGNAPTTASITERDIVESYADLLNELRLLTTVSVLLFGFLLTVARSHSSGEPRRGCCSAR